MKLELNEAEANAIIAALDIAVRQQGLSSAQMVSHIATKLQKAAEAEAKAQPAPAAIPDFKED